MASKRRQFGRIRKLPSGRYQARYLGPDGLLRPPPETFETKTDADDWLAEMQTTIRKKDWRGPDAGAVNFAKYADAWITERGVMPTTLELYRRLLRLHLEPTCGDLDLDEITPPLIRAWRAELRATGKHTTAAKAYRLMKSIMATATDDELIRRNPCRIKGAGKESAEERGVASIEKVYELAELVGLRWRAMVVLAAFTTLRPEELAELRRKDIDPVSGTVRVRLAAPELNTGRRALGDTKSDAGKRVVTIPAAVLPDVRLHLELFAERGMRACCSSERRAPRSAGPPSGESGARHAPRQACRGSASTTSATPATIWPPPPGPVSRS